MFRLSLRANMKVLHSICQQIWKTQQWPQDWKRSVFIPVPKKGNAKECSNYHSIVLISHTSKVMLKILQARLQQYMNHDLPDTQAGFRKGRGTRDQIASIHWIIKKAREFQKNIYFCFIDYTKAFECVDHNKLWKILKETGIPDHLTCPVRNPYAGKEATVRTGHGTTDWFQIGKGVCQGCMLSPCLFNLYAEYIQRWQWHPTPVLLPGKSHVRRSLVGCSPWNHYESDTTEQPHFHFSLSCVGEGNDNPLQCFCWRIPGRGEPGGLLSMGSHRVGHDWSDLAAAAAEYIIQNARLDEAQVGIKITGRNINNLRYADDTTLMAESKELKSLLMKVKEER